MRNSVEQQVCGVRGIPLSLFGATFYLGVLGLLLVAMAIPPVEAPSLA